MTTIGALLLAESHAAFLVRNHQRGCRAYRAGTDCPACDQYERDWLLADRALSEFQGAAGVRRW